jgi:FkbM family methyltransferase
MTVAKYDTKDIVEWVTIPANAALGYDSFELAINKAARDCATASLRAGQPIPDAPIKVALELLKPGDVALDVGAFVGAFALRAAAKGCGVIAFEPDPLNAMLLRTSIERNGWEEYVSVIEAAADYVEGRSIMYDTGPFGYIGPTTDTSGVRTVAIDDILTRFTTYRTNNRATPKVIKIDVEGGELNVLRGMSNLLNSPLAPVVIWEGNTLTLRRAEINPMVVKRHLSEFGYTSDMLYGDKRVFVEVTEPQIVVNVDYVSLRYWHVLLYSDVLPERKHGYTREQMIERVAKDIQAAGEGALRMLYIARNDMPPWLLFAPEVVDAFDKRKGDI